MGLVYTKSTREEARRYERSAGMEPNPGVSAMTVVNGRGHGPLDPNPFQWISGRGQRHVHESPAYRTVKGAKRWRAKNAETKARLYPVDERGTIVSRPVPSRTLASITANSGEDEMAYNVGALRRAIRSNGGLRRNQPDPDEMYSAMAEGGRGDATEDDVKELSGARSLKTNKASSKNLAKLKKRVSGRKLSRTQSQKRRVSASAKKTGSTTETKAAGGMVIVSPGKKRASKKKAASEKRASVKARASKKRTSKRTASKKAASKKATSKKAASKRASKRGGSRRVSASKRGGSRHSERGYFRQRAIRMTGREYLDKYIGRGLLPTVARVRRLPLSRSGSSPVLAYSIGSRVGRLSKRPLSPRHASPTKRAYAIGASYRGKRKRAMKPLAANRRGSRKASRRSRRSKPSLLRNTKRRASKKMSRRSSKCVSARRVSRKPAGRRSKRSSAKRTSSRRGSKRSVKRNPRYVMAANCRSRRRRSLRPNLLATSKVRWSGSGEHRMGQPAGRRYQLVEYGTKSGKFKRAGYPVLIPSHVSMHGYVRKFKFGGAAKDAHLRAKSSGYAERKKHPKRRSLKANSRRHSMAKRRRSTRRNPKYVLANERRRRIRENFLSGKDLVNDVLMPVGIGTLGFAAARVLSNGAANIEAVRGMLDNRASAADAQNTKLVANLVGIAATLGLGTKVPVIKRNQGALVTGMGLALADRLISRFAPDNTYLSGFGEYVNQPMSGFGEYVSQPLGEYISQPLGEYVSQPMGGVGEYVSQPMSGLGTMYATAGLGTMYATAGLGETASAGNQDSVDGLHDIMEAAAGVGVAEAAAGIGSYYAAADLGAEADASHQRMYAHMQPPFTSIQTPTDVAAAVTREIPNDLPVVESLVTPEAKGKAAGGMFASNLFSGMMGY